MASALVARFVTLAIAATAGASAAAPDGERGERGDGATVAGRVTLGGIRPSGDSVWVTPGGSCPRFIPDDRIVAQADGSLRDVVVMLFPIAAQVAMAPAAPGEAEVRALHCGLEPRVQVARPGSLLVVTSEPTASHLLHAYRDGNTLWEEVIAGRRPQLLRQLGAVDLRCDTKHEWELAWVYVTDAPWVAVTDAGGRFSLRAVPRGGYRLRAWHPYLGKIEVPIEVEPDREAGIVVAFAGRGKIDALYPEDWVEIP